MTLKGPPVVDKRYIQGGPSNGWNIPDAGGLVTWSPYFGMATYQWTMPQTIPPTGVPVKLSVDVTANAPSRFAPAISISGGLLDVSPTVASALAEPGQTAHGDATAELKPPASGGTVQVVVGIQDGPTYTYTYESKPVASASVSLSYAIHEPGRELSPHHVAVGTTVQLVAKATPSLPNGTLIQIFDKPQGATQAPKSGYLIRTCSSLPCNVDRSEKARPRVHAYRAFLLLGNATKSGFKMLDRSNTVVITWEEPMIPVELTVQTTNGGLAQTSGRVPVGALVTLRADATAPLPPGTQIRITWTIGGSGFGSGIKLCSTSPCIGTKYYRLPATLDFVARVIRQKGGKTTILGQSKPVPVTWAPR
jgi:hypothetical protein